MKINQTMANTGVKVTPGAEFFRCFFLHSILVELNLEKGAEESWSVEGTVETKFC